MAELVEELLRDRVFFEEAEGGVTISGGEPLAQSEFTSGVLRALRREGIHTCVDTSLHADYSQLRPLLADTNLFLVDYKETDPDRHRHLTGVHPARILENLERLSRDGAEIWLRCPIVPGINDRREHLEAAGELAARTAGVSEVWVLPFHPTAAHKWSALGRKYAFERLNAPGTEQVADWAQVIGSRTSKPVRYSGATVRTTDRSAR